MLNSVSIFDLHVALDTSFQPNRVSTAALHADLDGSYYVWKGHQNP